MGSSITFTTPVGRFVQGSTSKPREKDAEGRPLVIKTGPNAGKPTVQYYMAIAIPKGPERHWAETQWGSPIWQLGHQAFPNIAQRPDFAWKIIDGDSAIPNKKGKKPCDTEGFKGNWIIRTGSTFAPSCWNKDGSQAVPPDQIKCGYYIQLSIQCAGNDSQQQPGLYMNANMIALAGFGPEIAQGADPAAAGFGQNVSLPPGASDVPPASFNPIPPTPPIPGAPSAPAMAPPAGPVYVPPPAGTAPPASHSSVPPNPAFVAIPPIPGASPVSHVPSPASVTPAVAPPPTSPSRPVMLPAANGVPYESYIAKGWTDALLRQHGYMQ